MDNIHLIRKFFIKNDFKIVESLNNTIRIGELSKEFCSSLRRLYIYTSTCRISYHISVYREGFFNAEECYYDNKIANVLKRVNDDISELLINYNNNKQQ